MKTRNSKHIVHSLPMVSLTLVTARALLSVNGPELNAGLPACPPARREAASLREGAKRCAAGEVELLRAAAQQWGPWLALRGWGGDEISLAGRDGGGGQLARLLSICRSLPPLPLHGCIPPSRASSSCGSHALSSRDVHPSRQNNPRN